MTKALISLTQENSIISKTIDVEEIITVHEPIIGLIKLMY